MGNVRFVEDPTFEPELYVSPVAKDVIDEATAAVADAARDYVPKRLGFLKAGIKTVFGFNEARYVGRVVSTDFKAGWYEFGYRSKPNGEPYLRPALALVLPGAPILGGGG